MCIRDRYVAEGMKKAGAEVGLFELDKIDEAFVAEAKAVVFGAPTFYADTCWQMKKFFDETKLPLAGKIGATFGTCLLYTSLPGERFSVPGDKLLLFWRAPEAVNPE